MKNDPTFKFVALAIVAALAIAFINPSHANSPTTQRTAERIVNNR